MRQQYLTWNNVQRHFRFCLAQIIVHLQGGKHRCPVISIIEELLQDSYNIGDSLNSIQSNIFQVGVGPEASLLALHFYLLMLYFLK